MWLWHLRCLLLVLALAGCNGDRPETINIIGIERRADLTVPPLSRLRALDPVALAIRIPRQNVPAIVDRASRIEFITFPCDREMGRYQLAELYGDGVPLGRDWRLDGLDPRLPMPGTVTLIAFVQRRLTDGGGPQCARFIELGRRFLGLDTVYIISNTVRLPPAPAAVH
jgi:hypothetical protein